MNQKLLGIVVLAILVAVGIAGCPAPTKQGAGGDLTPKVTELTTKVADLDKAVTDLVKIQPKYARTMREYGDRFSEMWFAAKNGNWALAAYEDHYMRRALDPLTVTKPEVLGAVGSFHKNFLDPLLKTIGDKDFAAFQAQYTKTIGGCNDCHKATGYTFVIFTQPTEPATKHLKYENKTEPTEYKDFKKPS